MKLNEQSLIPLYRQVMNDIRAKIGEGAYATGDKIPSEAELSELYSVSRITIRRAIEELSIDGLLTKKQGKGTYVNPPRLEHRIVQLRDVQAFADTCRGHGRIPSLTLLHREVTSANEMVQEFFGVAPDTPILHLRYVCRADGVPVMLEDDYVPYAEFAFLERIDLKNTSVFDAMGEHAHRRPVNQGQCLLEIVRATPEAAQCLHIAAGEPLYNISASLYDGEGRPITMSHALIVGSLYAFNLV